MGIAVSFLCSTSKARFFVPTHALPWASCRDAVKAGRCVSLWRARASRPRLDGVEHEATLAWIGAMISQPADKGSWYARCFMRHEAQAACCSLP